MKQIYSKADAARSYSAFKKHSNNLTKDIRYCVWISMWKDIFGNEANTE